MSPKKCLVKWKLYRTALNQTERYQGQREVKLNAVWDSAELQNVGDLIKWWIKNRNETLWSENRAQQRKLHIFREYANF